MPAAITARSSATTTAATTAVVSVHATSASTSPRSGRTSPIATDTASAATARSSRTPADGARRRRAWRPASTISTHMMPAHSSHRSCVRSRGACTPVAHPHQRDRGDDRPERQHLAAAEHRLHGSVRDRESPSSVDPTGSPAANTTASGARSSIDRECEGRAEHGDGDPAPATGQQVPGRVEQQQRDQPGEQERPDAARRTRTRSRCRAGRGPGCTAPSRRGPVEGPHHCDQAEQPPHRGHAAC